MVYMLLLLFFMGTILVAHSSMDLSAEARFEVDVAWEFDGIDRGGWGNATAEEMQMEVRVENHELRASVVGWEPAIDSPPLALDVTRRHYVVLRMMYFGGADTAQLMLKSGGAYRVDRDRVDWGSSYWVRRLQSPRALSASGEEPGYPVANAVDGKEGTSWVARFDPLATPYIDMDMDERRWVTSVHLFVELNSNTPKRCYLQRSRVHSTGPFETVGDFVVSNSSREQWFGGINAYGRYWRLRIMSNHGGPTTGIKEVELHGADEEVSIAPFELSNALNNKGVYKNYYIPIHQFLSGTLLRMRLRLFTQATAPQTDNNLKLNDTRLDRRGRAMAQYREGLAIDYVRVVRAPEIWRVRGCLDVYSKDISFSESVYNTTHKYNFINTQLELRYFEKNAMDLQYARTFDCPVEGGVDIQIDGLNFGPHARVFVGSSETSHTIKETSYGSGREQDDGRGNECIVKKFSRDPKNGRIETLICTLPPGTAGPKLVRVENENMPGIFQQAPLFSYRVAPPVMNLPRVANIGARRVDLQWKPSGNIIDNTMITGYKILWFNPKTRSQIHNMTVGNVTTTSVRGLMPNTEYIFAIAAVSEGAHHEKSANLPTDLYGRRKLTGNAMVGTFSTYTEVTTTLENDIDYGGFNAGLVPGNGPRKDLKEKTIYGPTGVEGSEGNYGIVLVGSANVQNCNSSSTCCDGYDGSSLDSCGAVCATILEERLARDYVIGGQTRREVPSNIKYDTGKGPEKVIFDNLQQLRDSMLNGSQGAPNPNSACGPALRLTGAEARQSGSAWYNRKMNVREGFDTSFTFEISNPSMRCDRLDDVNTYCRSRGADGIAFVLQDESNIALGLAGKGLGYEGIRNALAIELDTYSNFDQMDPYENHISVTTQGFRDKIVASHKRSLGDTTRIPDLSDGIHTVRIKYDPNFDSSAVPHPSFQTNGYTTWFIENADFRNGGEGDWGTGFGLLYVYIDDLYSPVLTTPLNLEATLEMDFGRMFVGLTSATGDSNWQAHDILSWQFQSLYIDRLYEPPVVVNGVGAHQCVDDDVCVHQDAPEYVHYMRTNKMYDGAISADD